MQDNKKVFIKTAPVNIKVVEVGGKKMTLSVFNQIPEEYYYELYKNKDSDNIIYLGWVGIKDGRDLIKYYLYSFHGILKKAKADFTIANYRDKSDAESYSKYLPENGYYLNDKNQELAIAFRDRILKSILEYDLYKQLTAPEHQIYISI
jgi:hypothetical protein